MPEFPVVQLPALTGRQQESWLALVELAPALGKHCLLVGGQMVFLHQVEREAADVRPTDDVDVVVNLRVNPSGLRVLHRVLTNADFDQAAPGPDGIAHRYRRRGAMIDVLAPDNLGVRARLTLGDGRTVAAPGATQALTRSSLVSVRLVGGEEALIRRPSLVGALLAKVAAATVIVSQSSANRAKHFSDVDSLARLLGPDDRDQANLSAEERAILGQIGGSHDLSPLAQRSIELLAGTFHGDRSVDHTA
jgi:hypothetical protein